MELTISQREVGKIPGATPEGLSRALRKVAHDGILATAGRTIIILDHKALERLKDGIYRFSLFTNRVKGGVPVTGRLMNF